MNIEKKELLLLKNKFPEKYIEIIENRIEKNEYDGDDLGLMIRPEMTRTEFEDDHI